MKGLKIIVFKVKVCK